MRAAAILACILIVATLIAACSGPGSGEATPAPATNASATPAPTDPPTPTTPPTATPMPEPTPVTIESQAERILKLVPVKPGNINLYTSDYLANPVYPEAYLDGSVMEPAVGTTGSVHAMRRDLQEFLETGLGPDAPEVAATLALFDDAGVSERVPDPRLRAAFVVLNITVAAPLIDSFITSDVYAWNLTWEDTGLAFTESSTPGPDGKQRIAVSDRYRYEHFAAIAPNIAHAMLHHDETFSYAEDVIVVAIATVSYLQLVELHPEIAYQGTELTRFNNTFAMALLNSHRAGNPDIELIVSGGTSVLPGSTDDAADFWSLIAVSDTTSEIAPALPAILTNMLTLETAVSTQLRFDRETAELIGGHIRPEILGPQARVRLSVLLTMISTDEIAALLDLTRAETIDLFGLQPIEDVLTAHS